MLVHTLVMLALRSLRQKNSGCVTNPGYIKRDPVSSPHPHKKRSNERQETERDGQTDRQKRQFWNLDSFRMGSGES